MKQSTFQQPIRREGCLFLAYCFMANLRTDAQVNKAFNYACNRGWLTTTSCYCNTGMDTFINGLCSYFGTTRMSGVTRKHVNNNSHWIVVSSSTGATVYDSIYGYSGSVSPSPSPSTTKIRTHSWTAYCEASSLNVRKSASTSSSIIGSIKKGATVQVTAEYLASNGYIWYYVTSGSVKGYVHSGYIVPKSISKKTVSTSVLNVRVGPSTSYKKLPAMSTIKSGQKVSILSTENGWCRIAVGSDPRTVGYVSSSYLK